MQGFFTWIGEAIGLIPESEETLVKRREEREQRIIQFVLEYNSPLVLYPVDCWHSVHITCCGTSLPCHIDYRLLDEHVITPHYLKKIFYCTEVFRAFGFPEIRNVILPFFVQILNIRTVRNTEYMALHYNSMSWRFIESNDDNEYATLDPNTFIVSAPNYRMGIMGPKDQFIIEGMQFQPPLL